MIDCAIGTDPAPDERLREVATLLAAGLLRLRKRLALPTDKTPQESPQCPSVGLEVPAELWLSGGRG